MTCNCKGIEFGTYENCVHVQTPQGKLAGIDICVLPEVFSLWKKGIQTIESCCGHNKTSGYIAVIHRHRNIMDALGYKPDPQAPHCYLLKGGE